MIHKIQSRLPVFVQNRDLQAKSNDSERALRSCTAYRKITDGFRQE